jgi:hypothetical protein
MERKEAIEIWKDKLKHTGFYNTESKEAIQLLISIAERVDEETLNSAIRDIYFGQRADEEIIDWDNRTFNTKLLANKLAQAITQYLEGEKTQ